MKHSLSNDESCVAVLVIDNLLFSMQINLLSTIVLTNNFYFQIMLTVLEI